VKSKEREEREFYRGEGRIINIVEKFLRQGLFVRRGYVLEYLVVNRTVVKRVQFKLLAPEFFF
jgi:hypothetical protein